MQTEGLAYAAADDRAPAAGKPGTQPAKRRGMLGNLDKYVAILIFLAGLLAGWLGIGWWLWPARAAGCGPWELQPECQERYVVLVAADLARTGSLAQAQRDLAGWDAEALAALLTTIERDTASPEAREPLVGLRQALALPDSPPSLWMTLLRQRAIFWTGALALVLLAAALALAIAPPHYGGKAATRRGQPGEDDAALAGRGAAEKIQLPGLDGDGAQDDDEAAGPAAARNQPGQQGAAQAQQTGSQPSTRQVQRVRLEEENSSAKGVTVEEIKGDQEEPAEDDGSGTGDPQSILSELLEDIAFVDPRHEALLKIVKNVDIGDLMDQTRQVLDHLRRIPHRRGLEAG